MCLSNGQGTDLSPDLQRKRQEGPWLGRLSDPEHCSCSYPTMWPQACRSSTVHQKETVRLNSAHSTWKDSSSPKVSSPDLSFSLLILSALTSLLRAFVLQTCESQVQDRRIRCTYTLDQCSYNALSKAIHSGSLISHFYLLRNLLNITKLLEKWLGS